MAESATVPHEPQPKAEMAESQPEASEAAPPAEKAAEVEVAAEPEPLVVEPPASTIVVEIPEERLALLREQVNEIMSAWEIK